MQIILLVIHKTVIFKNLDQKMQYEIYLIDIINK